MNLRSTLANAGWLATGLPARRRFSRALDEPAAAQWQVLRTQLTRNAASAYGRNHGFAEIRSPEDFARRVPVVGYEELEPWTDRIRRGESSVLTTEPVTRLIPTSGSSGARKLIPFTASVQREFNAAISPWMADLVRQHPTVPLGPAYWSVTPMAQVDVEKGSAVPIGFDDDRRYLGGTRAWLVESLMAVPTAVRHITDLTAFRHAVLLCLLRHADLRLVSVWHPSFFALLLDALPAHWDALLSDLSEGNFRYADQVPVDVLAALHSRPRPRLVDRLKRCTPELPETLWPDLRVVSCWADGHAGGAATALGRRLPQAVIQSKGLLATEAFVTIPYEGAHPLALCSHYFEFSDEAGEVHPAHALRSGVTYGVIVTTGGGLWRYRLGDQVEVTGFVGRTPSLRFIGRAGGVSDRCGEKLSEAFVIRAIEDAFAPTPVPAFAMLAPEEGTDSWHYVLYVDVQTPVDLGPRLDTALRANPHYALCRDLGQLGPIRTFRIASGAYESYATAGMARGLRLGDLKPAALSAETDWSKRFTG